jgi:hypothetical protein
MIKMKRDYLVTKEVQNGATTSWTLTEESARVAIERSMDVTQEMINSGTWTDFDDGSAILEHGYITFEAHAWQD